MACETAACNLAPRPTFASRVAFIESYPLDHRFTAAELASAGLEPFAPPREPYQVRKGTGDEATAASGSSEQRKGVGGRKKGGKMPPTALPAQGGTTQASGKRARAASDGADGADEGVSKAKRRPRIKAWSMARPGDMQRRRRVRAPEEGPPHPRASEEGVKSPAVETGAEGTAGDDQLDKTDAAPVAQVPLPYKRVVAAAPPLPGLVSLHYTRQNRAQHLDSLAPQPSAPGEASASTAPISPQNGAEAVLLGSAGLHAIRTDGGTRRSTEVLAQGEDYGPIEEQQFTFDRRYLLDLLGGGYKAYDELRRYQSRFEGEFRIRCGTNYCSHWSLSLLDAFQHEATHGQTAPIFICNVPHCGFCTYGVCTPYLEEKILWRHVARHVARGARYVGRCPDCFGVFPPDQFSPHLVSEHAYWVDSSGLKPGELVVVAKYAPDTIVGTYKQE
ncbi:hypothetical protein JCM3770_004021 [Rhodotorula araucariae]